MKIAIMQPSFLPPAQYFRLFAATDLFVILDSVQFSRRWYTHRQKLLRKDGKLDWLTLPLAYMPQSSLIHDMCWHDDYKERWEKEVGKFENIENMVIPAWQTPLVFICSLLKKACEKIDIPFNVALSSNVVTPTGLRGQDGILHLCKHFKATEYVNSPGGRSLYDVSKFAKEGMSLRFLPEVDDTTSILDRLAMESAEKVRAEIYDSI